MQYLNMCVNKYLIMASHDIKIKKSNSITIPLFDLPYSYWGYARPHSLWQMPTLPKLI